MEVLKSKKILSYRQIKRKKQCKKLIDDKFPSSTRTSLIGKRAIFFDDQKLIEKLLVNSSKRHLINYIVDKCALSLEKQI